MFGDLWSMFIFITKCTLKNTACSSTGRVYIYNLFTFSPYRYSSSTLLTRNKIHSDTILPPQIPKNHSTHIFGQNLTIPYPNITPRTTTKQPKPTPSLPYLT